jgi:hypothetical protein
MIQAAQLHQSLAPHSPHSRRTDPTLHRLGVHEVGCATAEEVSFRLY